MIDSLSMNFIGLLNRSINAVWLILAVMLLRVILRRAPKRFICYLWAIVGIRLICPFNFSTVLSLIPSGETIPYDIALQKHPQIESGITVIDETINPIMGEVLAPNIGDSANPLQILIPIAEIIWVTGVIVLLAYALISYIRLKRTITASVALEDRIMSCDGISVPFILGVLDPRICIPSAADKSELDMVIRHEKAHLKRYDHLWKPLGFLILAVHWFNPLCWIAYILLCKDIELACDERVIRDMTREDIAAYSQALLDYNRPEKKILLCPVAFAEVGVKERIKNALNYRKPSFWIILVSIILCIAVAVFFTTDPFPYSNILGMERSDISGITVTSQIHVPVRIVSLSEKDIDSFVEYCNSLRLRYKGTTEEKGGWQYFFNVTKKNGEMKQISVMDDGHIRVDKGVYESSKPLYGLTEFVVGLDYPVDEPEGGETGYEACSFITYRNGHYEIGVEIHTNHRTPIDLKLIDIQEFEGLVTLVEDSPPENEVKYYCNSGTFTQHYKVRNTVDIREEDIDKVIDIMRKHIYELTLADLEGYYPAIIDSTVLDVVVDIE